MKAFAMMLLATALTMTDTTSMPSQRRFKQGHRIGPHRCDCTSCVARTSTDSLPRRFRQQHASRMA
ncbi:hypothetical protein CPBF1521_19310 [Xanthomonas arboricola pv. juglandis]|nr:hypothetical protein CPBF1521_19310 [Xanthomonas arboricola pv. juglandis]SYZ61002.1 hypothetical protein CPBF427_31700 [Xanthomonas arboricola pv. juglandis]